MVTPFSQQTTSSTKRSPLKNPTRGLESTPGRGEYSGGQSRSAEVCGAASPVCVHAQRAEARSLAGTGRWSGGGGPKGPLFPGLRCGTKSGYRFEIQCARLFHLKSAHIKSANIKDANKKDASKNDASEKCTGYTVTAVPVVSGRTRRHALCSEAYSFQTSGEIWYSESGVAAECLAGRKAVGAKYR